LGFLGDATTFAGAFILAMKEAGEEKRARQKLGTVTAIETYPELKKITIDIEGIVIEKKEDLEIAFARGPSRRSRLGACILAIGFVFLFLSRFAEVFTSK